MFEEVNRDGSWFLFEPAEPPFPCTPDEGKIWFDLEREMWEFYVLASLTDEVKPLFPDLGRRHEWN